GRGGSLLRHRRRAARAGGQRLWRGGRALAAGPDRGRSGLQGLTTSDTRFPSARPTRPASARPRRVFSVDLLELDQTLRSPTKPIEPHVTYEQFRDSLQQKQTHSDMAILQSLFMRRLERLAARTSHLRDRRTSRNPCRRPRRNERGTDWLPA